MEPIFAGNLPEDLIYDIMSRDFATLALFPCLCKNLAQRFRVVQIRDDADFNKLEGEKRILSIDASSYKIWDGLDRIAVLRVRYLKLFSAYNVNLEHLRFAKDVQVLDLSHCDQLNWEQLRALCGIQKLMLRGCKIEDKHLGLFSGMQALETLDLSHCYVTDEGLHTLSCLPKLYSLNLESCQDISPKIGLILPSFKALRVLRVTGCWQFHMAKSVTVFSGINLTQDPIYDPVNACLDQLDDLTL